MLHQIDNYLAQLQKLRPLSPDSMRRLLDDFSIEYTYNSNAIEGNTLTYEETSLILKEGITIAEKPLKDHLEAVSHREAFLYVEELVKQRSALTERVIRDIHSIVLMDKPQSRGVYRSVPVRIGGTAHEPPQPWQVPIEMEKLLLDYPQMEQMHPIERIALFHLRFECIHPFVDGNGRTGRLILNLELMKDGYPPIDVKFADRRTYYAAFRAYQDSNYLDASAMTDLVGKYVLDALINQVDIVLNSHSYTGEMEQEQEDELEME